MNVPTNKLPFTITILDNKKSRLGNLEPVTSLDIFDGMSKDFHPNGLYSIPLFGKQGDEQRLDAFSYIDMRTEVLHPYVFKEMISIKRFYKEILSGESYAQWDAKRKDFVRSNEIKGKTGYGFFMSKWREINFGTSKSYQRQKTIRLLNDYRDKAPVRYLMVLPAGMRDITVEEGKTSEDDINNHYRKAITLANTIIGTEESRNDPMNDMSRWGLQLAFNEVFNTIFKMLKGKKSFPLAKWASRRIHYGTANVISSKEMSCSDLDSPGRVDPRVTFCGLYQSLLGNRTKSIYSILNGFLESVFDSDNREATVVDSKTLKSKRVSLNYKWVDKWRTVEGINKLLNSYENEKMRHDSVKLGKDYIGLIYDFNDDVKLFNGIDTLPEHICGSEKMAQSLIEDKRIRPVTYTELFYLLTAASFEDVYGTVTRYPIAGFGSIYISRVVTKTTTTSFVKRVLNSHWAADDSPGSVVTQFPDTLNRGYFLNTMQPDASRLSALVADFDGDRCSLNFLHTDEGLAAARKQLNTLESFIDPSSPRLTISCNTDIIDWGLRSMTSGMR